MVVTAAVFPVMQMIADKMGVDPRFFNNPAWNHQRVQRPPLTMQEIIAPGVQFPTGWHTGHTADITIVKGGGMCRQALKVRRFR